MPLKEVKLQSPALAPAPAAAAFLREANERVRRFQETSRTPGFVPCDFEAAHAFLGALAEANLAPGERFCEWGCGFGVVAGLAALFGFEACGIEIDEALAAEAQQLADDFGLPVEIIRGSFIPRRAERYLDRSFARSGEGFSWLALECDGALEAQGMAPEDFDIIFAYPWPDEECFVAGLFERTAAEGALLATHHGAGSFRLRRKVQERKKRAGRDVLQQPRR